MSNIKIGWGEVSLVPQGRKVNLSGQFYERITDEVETPISVTSLAIECGDDSVIFCSCDLVHAGEKVLAEARRKLEGTGVPLNKIILSVIHSHTSIEYEDAADGVGGSSLDVLAKLMPDAKYETLVSYEGDDLLVGKEAFDFVTDKIAESVKLAWENRKDGMYAQGFGRAAVGMCRRVCYDDGSAKMWGDTDMANFAELEAGNDSGIELLFTFDTEKNLSISMKGTYLWRETSCHWNDYIRCRLCEGQSTACLR